MGRGNRKPKKPKKLEKKVKNYEDKIKRRPWLRPEPAYLVSRFMWDAKSPKFSKAKEELALPVGHVVLNYHSRFPACTTPAHCRSVMQHMQNYQCELMSYQDLAYNWYIAGDGHAYEGRGWTKHPKLQHELSTECIEIAYMGDYPLTYDPSEKMVEVFNQVVNYGIEKNFIAQDYVLHEFRLPPRPLKQPF